MKILVTGGAGFIGSNLVDALCNQGEKVLVIDSLDPGVFQACPAYLNPKAEYCFSDLRYWVPDARFADVECVVHLAALGGVSRAAKQTENVITSNCGGTAKLVEWAHTAAKLRKFVLASSFSVYGSGYQYHCPRCDLTRDAARREDDLQKGRFEVYCRKCGGETRIVPITTAAHPSPLEIYGASKYMQELCLLGMQDVDVTVLRFSSVYGDRLRLDDGEATIIAKLAGWIRDGSPPQLFEDGKQIRDWVFVGDLVQAVLRLAAGRQAPRVVNVCSGQPTTLVEACQILARVMDRNVEPVVKGGYRPGDMRHCLGDAAEFAQLLESTPMTFAQGAATVFGRKAGAGGAV